ncbi:hypothetical protein HYALB_00010803, partial [Hymenoscyphus albidus]
KTSIYPQFLLIALSRSNNPPNPAQRAVRQIRGPQSALTDFLASHNISAQQIRHDANARRAAALASEQAAAGTTGDDENEPAEPDSDPEPVPSRRKRESKAQTNKRKKEEEKAISKIKNSKRFKRSRRQHGSDENVSDEDEAARAFFEESMAPLPYQMENCEICDKRFRVTAYSRKGDDGGLLCPQCTKELDKEEGAARKRRKTAVGRQRRQVQSNLLDGIYPGAKDLMTLCIETLAKNVDLAEDLGDLPETMVNRLSGIISKRRLMNSNTLNLFLRAGAETVNIHEGALLTPDDYIRVFQYSPTVKNLLIKDGVQFKNRVMDHLLDTTVKLESFSIHGANLIDDERWNRFLTEKGFHLHTLRVYWTDGHFGDEQLELLGKTCPDLQVLKVSHNQKVTGAGIAHLSKLTKLERLTLNIYGGKTKSEPYVEVLNATGLNLKCFCLDTVNHIDDDVLQAIHDNCQRLTKLRITDNHVLTDQGFANLFTDWPNPPLTHIDFNKCRVVDSTEPKENPDGIGLSSLGFKALMKHSGKTLRYLDVSSCRHISCEAFESVFAADKTYPELRKLDLSFCQQVNDLVVLMIFRSCPNIESVAVFGNFGVRDVRVPKGKILIGVPTALGMQIEGTEDGVGRVI